MGQQQSKDELLYQQVSYGNIDGIKTLHREGARLEYVDREGKTPLIAACLNPALHNVAKTLLDLGANVNAYRPGRNGGTPLHHASKRGLEDTVKLLLSHGANALLLNDDCQTALEIARAKGYTNVVRAIENHICLYSGWLRELYGPGFLEIFAPQLMSRKVWVVVLPCGSRYARKPFKLELAIYGTMQDAQPRINIALSRAAMEEPAFNHPEPAVIISESTISRGGRRRRCKPRRVSQTRVKLAPVTGNDNHQLQQFCSACKGIPQVVHSNFPFNTPSPVVPSLPATAPPANPQPAAEDLELAMAIDASIQTAVQEGLALDHSQASHGASSSATVVHAALISNQSEPLSGKASCTGHFLEEEVGTSGSAPTTTTTTTDDTQTPAIVPSAPTLSDEVLPDGPIHYPTIDTTTMDTTGLVLRTGNAEDENSKGNSSSCVICFDAPVEAACVPCGHMAGCISCLNEIKEKKWGCPVCRTKIDQVIKVYVV